MAFDEVNISGGEVVVDSRDSFFVSWYFATGKDDGIALFDREVTMRVETESGHGSSVFSLAPCDDEHKFFRRYIFGFLGGQYVWYIFEVIEGSRDFDHALHGTPCDGYVPSSGVSCEHCTFDAGEV